MATADNPLIEFSVSSFPSHDMIVLSLAYGGEPTRMFDLYLSFVCP